VELRRREDDGEYRFYIVGRDHDLTEPLTETIDVGCARTSASCRAVHGRSGCAGVHALRRTPDGARRLHAPSHRRHVEGGDATVAYPRPCAGQEAGGPRAPDRVQSRSQTRPASPVLGMVLGPNHPRAPPQKS